MKISSDGRGISETAIGRNSAAGNVWGDRALCRRVQPSATGQPQGRQRRLSCKELYPFEQSAPLSPITSDPPHPRAPHVITPSSLGITTSIVRQIAITFLVLHIMSWTVDDISFIPQEIETLPSRIVISEGASYLRPPFLRGCCGEPAEFRWVFFDDVLGAVAGKPFRTRVVALDAWGRHARPSSCRNLWTRVDLSSPNHAFPRLSSDTSYPSWRGAELWLNIESETTGEVEAEVRIAKSSKIYSEILMQSSHIKFEAGPPFALEILVRRPDDGDDLLSGMRLPLGELLGISVGLRDRFGNEVPLSPTEGNGLALRSNSSFVEFIPDDGRLTLDAAGKAKCSIRCTMEGAVELWPDILEEEAEQSQRGEAEARHAVRRMLSGRQSLFTFDFVSTNSVQNGRSMVVPVLAGDVPWQALAAEVKVEFAHAWNGYKRYAWGRDELQPLSKKGRDSFGGIGMTILDSLTTLWLMDLREEFDLALKFVQDDLHFGNADRAVSVFELIIRALGGLLGAHALSGKEILLTRAQELATLLLPALNTSSKLPLPKLNLATGLGEHSGEPTILSEAGSMQLEFRYLSAQTKDPKFRQAADAAFRAIRSTRLKGILPVYLTPPHHAQVHAIASKLAVGALADSYYEYLLKQWLQSPKEIYFKEMWLAFVDDLPDLLAPRPPMAPPISGAAGKAPAKAVKTGVQSSYKLLEAKPNGKKLWKMDHLSCFIPGILVLGLTTLTPADLRHLNRNETLRAMAEGITSSCYELYTLSKSGLAPECATVEPQPPYRFLAAPQDGRHSFLRPETVESLFYMYRFTGDEKYRQWGKRIFRSIQRHAKVDVGYASVQDVNVVPTQKLDEMQSFVMAETFKYLYLLFSPASVLDLDRFILNTEAHPLPRGVPI